MTTTPQDALAVTTAVTPRGGHRSPYAALARIEAWRFARHPMFLVGTALGIVFTAMALNEEAHQVTSDSLSLPVVALTVGVASMITAYHLTRSFHGAGELLEASPTSVTTRTAALCLMAGVPALVASAWPVLARSGRDGPRAELDRLLRRRDPARRRCRPVVALPRRVSRPRAGGGGVDLRRPRRLHQ